MIILGIDIGGTKLNATVFKRESLNQLEPIYEELFENKGEVLSTVMKIIESLQQKFPIERIGLASAGRIDSKTGKVIYVSNNLKNWKGCKVKEILESKFGIPVNIENDVNCAAWAEYIKNQLSGNTIFISLGTGVGGAYIQGNELLVSRNFAAGEVGHMILYPHGIPCHCGKEGCLERYISGKAIEAQVKEKTKMKIIGKLQIQDELKDEKSVIRKHFVENLAFGLMSIQNLLDPDTIVIGGGLGETSLLWKEELANYLKEYSNLPIQIKYSTFENRAAVYGAALLAQKEN